VSYPYLASATVVDEFIEVKTISDTSFPEGTLFAVYFNDKFYKEQGWLNWDNAGNIVVVKNSEKFKDVKIKIKLLDGTVLVSKKITIM
jgi:hypothetical protein